MPSYLEGDSMQVILEGKTTMIKPILFTQYDKVIKYNLLITYEDSTTKEVELVQKCKDRPYKFIYKKEGKLLQAIGVPTITEIRDGCIFTDFPNRVMDANDLLFEVDCSGYFDCNMARFYLKDVRDIIDLANEPIEDPNDPMEVFPFTMFPIYLEEHSCQNVINCEVDENLNVTLTARVTKLGETLEEGTYSGFSILLVTPPVMIDSTIAPEINKVPLVFTEESLGTEIKVILKYFVHEINHPVFDEFTIIAHKKGEVIDGGDDNGTGTDTLKRAVSTQDMQYLGDGLEPALGAGLTPGFKEYQYKARYKK